MPMIRWTPTRTYPPQPVTLNAGGRRRWFVPRRRQHARTDDVATIRDALQGLPDGGSVTVVGDPGRR